MQPILGMQVPINMLTWGYEMNRFIKNYDPKDITLDLLYNTNDWDLIELNYDLDPAKLTEWWTDVQSKFPHLFFGFNENTHKLDLEKSKELVEQGYCGYYCGPIEGLTLAWPVDRDEPLPPPTQANLELFPEVNKDTFFHDAKIMEKFEYGYFKEIVETFGEEYAINVNKYFKEIYFGLDLPKYSEAELLYEKLTNKKIFTQSSNVI